MYSLLSALLGVLTAVMIALNGALAQQLGNAAATSVIHLLGLVLVAPLILLSRAKPAQARPFSPFLLAGGALGFLTVACANASMAEIGVSMVLALNLLGQTTSALLIDHYGWLGVARSRAGWRQLASLALIVTGIAVMTLL